MRRWRLYVFLAGFALPAAALSSDDKAGAANQQLSRTRCERMVERLVNHAEPPFKGYRAEHDAIPSSKRRGILDEQKKRVNRAYDALNDDIESALPVLVKHLRDQRFSHIRQDPATDAWHRVDVGMACDEIVQMHVEVYRGCINRSRVSLHFIRDECGGVAKWWQARKGKPLLELQLEACAWVLRHRTKPDWYPSNFDWNQALRCVERKVRKLRESKKPEVNRFYPTTFTLELLPSCSISRAMSASSGQQHPVRPSRAWSIRPGRCVGSSCMPSARRPSSD